jgi:eukaryotic-like serine/threonine-protein kinase
MEGTYRCGARFGQYEILSLLGMNLGEIYRARDPNRGLDVVLKVFSASRLGMLHREEKRRDLEREAGVARALDNHPNILAIYDVGTWDGVLFITMELLQGQSLQEKMKGNPLSVATSVEYSLQIARVLATAHERGITHGCLSPSNVFITLNNCVKVLGFGADAPGALPTMLGYVAPEQILQQACDHRVDIFALGAILFEMLAGACPFRRDSATETVRATLQEDPPPLGQLNPGVSQELAQLVARSLAKDRAERFRRTGDLVLELEALARQV